MLDAPFVGAMIIIVLCIGRRRLVDKPYFAAQVLMMAALFLVMPAKVAAVFFLAGILIRMW